MNNPLASLTFDPREKLHAHKQFAQYLSGERVYPINVEVSPCGICQASCLFCFYANTGELGEHRNVVLKVEAIDRLLDDCVSMGVKSISWTGGGDPALHPQIAEIVRATNSKELEQGIFTNALAMPKYDPSLMSWVRVTITDKPFRPDCVKALRATKTLGIAFNYAGTQDDALLAETLKNAELVGANYVQVRPALRFHGETVDIAPPRFEHPLLYITGYKFAEARKPHGIHYENCEGYKFVPFVWENGDVDVCACMRKRAGYNLGNIYNQSFKSILENAPKSVPVHSNCQVCCRNHEINRAVADARQIKDRNFP